MAKRFTDTCKWEILWYRKLSLEEKCFWSYVLDRCNHAGIWEVDFELASVCVGVKLDEKRLRATFAERYFEIADGRKWVIRNFIPFQYVKLTPSVKAHKSVINILESEGLSYPYINSYSKGMGKGMVRVKDKDKDKDKPQDKDKDKDKGERLAAPEDTGRFGTDFYNLFLTCFRKGPNPVQQGDGGKIKRKYGWPKLKEAMLAMRSGGYGWGVDGANVDKWCRGDWDKGREIPSASSGRRDRVYKKGKK